MMMLRFPAMVAGMTDKMPDIISMAILSYTLSMKRITLANFIAIIILIMSLSFILPAAIAGNDHLEARQLQAAGNILPLQQLLDIIRENHPGTVLELELEHKGKRVIYEVEILGKDGQVTKLYIDAQTAEIIRSKKDD